MMFSATQHTIPVEKKHGAKNTETKICISGGKNVSRFLFLFLSGLLCMLRCMLLLETGFTLVAHDINVAARLLIAIDCDIVLV